MTSGRLAGAHAAGSGVSTTNARQWIHYDKLDPSMISLLQRRENVDSKQGFQGVVDWRSLNLTGTTGRRLLQQAPSMTPVWPIIPTSFIAECLNKLMPLFSKYQ
jgi:hypothetical protein